MLGKSWEKLKKILRKTYDHNLPVLRKTYDELTETLWKSYETLRKVWKINLRKEDLRKILGILELWTYDEVTTNWT